MMDHSPQKQRFDLDVRQFIYKMFADHSRPPTTGEVAAFWGGDYGRYRSLRQISLRTPHCTCARYPHHLDGTPLFQLAHKLCDPRYQLYLATAVLLPM